MDEDTAKEAASKILSLLPSNASISEEPPGPSTGRRLTYLKGVVSLIVTFNLIKVHQV